MIRRIAEKHLTEAMLDTPVVIVQGPRQCGKTTLVRHAASSLPYVTLDDSLALDAALRNPRAFLRAYPDGVVIDEVQRAPDLLRSIKAEVDEDRRPGRYILTGSTSLLHMPRITESLAGRMEVVPLWPFAGCELAESEPAAARLVQNPREVPDGSFPLFRLDQLFAGGFPEPVFRSSPARRRAWFEGYLKALIERDVRSLADIEGLTALPRLLRLAAAEAGETLNASSLSRESGIPHTTLQRYLALLEAVFLVVQVPAWQSGLTHRAIKAPRLCFVDSGILLSLLGAGAGSLSPFDGLSRRLAASWASMEMARQLPPGEGRVCHFRSIRRYEVPLVVERPDGSIVAFDVTPEPSPGSLKALEFLQEVAGDRFAGGWLLHGGRECRRVTECLGVAPLGVFFGAEKG